MLRLTRFSFALCSAALLASCSMPSPIPAGYTYHRAEYKSPPPPLADEIGYDFTVAANEKAVAAWREVAHDLVASLESGYVFQSRDIALIPPLGIDQVNNSLRYALHEAFSAKGYRLRDYSPDYAGVAVTMNPLQGDEKSAHEKVLDDYAASHDFARDDVAGIALTATVREGAVLVHEWRGIYSIPVYAYDPEFNRQLEFRDERSVGRAPFWTDKPELIPVPVRPAAPVRPAPAPETQDSSINKDELSAPDVKDEANKPLDLQEFNN